MSVNSVINRTYIVRSQAEYSAATDTVILRCTLETPSTGERRGFADIQALIEALQAELADIQMHIVSPEEEERHI
ncbi:MAG: hypothetical protein KF753_06555 [Caldilineaceae bacterium]|nr:hypothetical protein [Caldilineaceae bacterium]